MSHCHAHRASALSLAVLAALGSAHADTSATVLDTLVVEGEGYAAPARQYVAPSTAISEREVESINYTTVEDVVKYEPGMVVRRRYIGDSNGVVGIRGSNMFQTARTLVYADGLPLHYLLETRWNGAPRWGLVAADEMQSAEVIYGPFSAEYSGNAMGGVVNIETRDPQKREFHAEAGMFLQDYADFGADDSYTGHREFLSYGDRFHNLSLYLFHNHLDNDGQPMTFRSRSVSAPSGGETAVTGAISGLDSVGNNVVWVGDSGAAQSSTDLTKLKLGYEMGEWMSHFTLAFENREWKTRPDNYLRDGAGNAVWSGAALFDGQRFTVNSGHFAISDQVRKTVLLGANVEGPLANSDWLVEAGVSWHDVLEDESRDSDRNPSDPAYTTAGSITDYGDTHALNLDLKARTDRLAGRDDLNLVVGYHFEHNRLNIDNYDSANYITGERTARSTSTGGDTRTHAVFAQLGWNFMPDWDVAVGARYEHWETIDGYYYRHNTATYNDFADRSETGISPKFSIGFDPANPWSLRYSLARAYRFPIVEELYRNSDSILGTSIADETLEPEIGIHHNLGIEREIARGFVRVNLFHEVVEDVIWSQTDYTAVPTVSTFLPVDEVTTTGLELIVQQDRVMNSPLDLRFNVTFTDSEITRNAADPSVEGQRFPRMPKWRSNLLGTWHVTPVFDTALGVRFASNSFGNLDNSDWVEKVYGAQDAYLFVDLKANYQVTPAAKLSLGIDNLTDEVAYVAHPWPQRTFYLQGSVDF